MYASTKKETPLTLVGGGASTRQQKKQIAGSYLNATLQTAASSYMLDCDGLTLAKRQGLSPRSVCIAASTPWGFPQSARLVIAPNGNPAQLDFSACAGVDVIIRFDSDTKFGWLRGVVFAVLKANPRRLQAWHLGDAEDDKATLVCFKKGARK